jgi:hypothetical protein
MRIFRKALSNKYNKYILYGQLYRREIEVDFTYLDENPAHPHSQKFRPFLPGLIYCVLVL